MHQLCETKIVASKEFIVDAISTIQSSNVVKLFSSRARLHWKSERRVDFGSAVSETKRELRPCDPGLLSAESRECARGERECESFFRNSTFRIAGRENLAAPRRRDLLDACRAALWDLLPTLARFKSRSQAVFAKFITSHWDFSTAVDAAKSLLWKVHSKRRFTRGEAENLSRPAA